MRARHHAGFATIRTEGAILPRDLLARIAAGDRDLGGITPDAYHLSGEKLGEATTRAWHRLQGAWAAFRKETNPLRPEACSGGAVLDPGISPTRERWLLPLFQELGYGRLPTARAAPDRPQPLLCGVHRPCSAGQFVLPDIHCDSECRKRGNLGAVWHGPRNREYPWKVRRNDRKSTNARSSMQKSGTSQS